MAIWFIVRSVDRNSSADRVVYRVRVVLEKLCAGRKAEHRCSPRNSYLQRSEHGLMGAQKMQAQTGRAGNDLS